MQPYQERVIVEARELDEKIQKLIVFTKNSPTYQLLDIHEQTRLIQQLEFMKAYLDVLEARIRIFT